MQRISREAKSLAEEGMPRFAEAVRQAAATRRRTGEGVPVGITLEEFGGDFMLLYACVWYAASQRIRVLLYPSDDAPLPDDL